MARFPAWHYDGEVALRRYVLIEPRGARFVVIENDREIGDYAFSDLAFADEQGEFLVYRHEQIDGYRLGISNPPPPELAGLLPPEKRYGWFIDRMGLFPSAGVLAAISAVVAAVVLTSPAWIAPLVPESTEARMGEWLFDDFGGRVCSTPQGQAALAKLAGKLDGRGENLKVEVVNMQMVNAVALPGGRVLLFDGLLNEAESPDEVAAVLGHEIGHVRKRHVMQSLIRQMGLSVLLGGFDGSGGSTVSGLLSLSYSRDAESEADRYSIERMKAADISPEGGAAFFERLGGEDRSYSRVDTAIGYLSSHPHSADRKEVFRKAVGKRRYRPALSEEEWFALQDMCADDPDVADSATVFTVTRSVDEDGNVQETRVEEGKARGPVTTLEVPPPARK